MTRAAVARTGTRHTAASASQAGEGADAKPASTSRNCHPPRLSSSGTLGHTPRRATQEKLGRADVEMCATATCPDLCAWALEPASLGLLRCRAADAALHAPPATTTNPPPPTHPDAPLMSAAASPSVVPLQLDDADVPGVCAIFLGRPRSANSRSSSSRPR